LRNAPALLTLFSLCACALSEDAYRDEQVRLDCERDNACATESGEGTQACSALSAPPNNSAFVCSFDADAAQDCLDAIPTAECDGASYVQPPVCATVFVDCQPR
jgi:hypothetical protein